MGKRTDSRLRLEGRPKELDVECEAPSAPVCECCPPSSESADDGKMVAMKKHQETMIDTMSQDALQQEPYNESDSQELVVIGAGPHSLALVLRLLEPEPDLLSDKERHLRADYHNRMRPLSEVRRHIRDLNKGPKATLKTPAKNNVKSKKTDGTTDDPTYSPPPSLSLKTVREKVTVLDAGGDSWMTHWKQNFDEINISQLRSPIGAHADPYDHRALEFYAQAEKRSSELIPLPFVPKNNGRWDYHGPYNVPSTSLFNDFHMHLAEAYGIKDIVQQGRVLDIVPRHESHGGALFDLQVQDAQGNVSTITSKRVVCAMGPANSVHKEFLWEEALKQQIQSDIVFRSICGTSGRVAPDHRHDAAAHTLYATAMYSDRVLYPEEIVPWLTAAKTKSFKKPQRLLIVGGGITSAQLALLAADRSKSGHWCQSVTFIQRTLVLERQFDIPNEWMGPARGKLQAEFRALDPKRRVDAIQKERQGGSITPEVLEILKQSAKEGTRAPRLHMKVQVEIESVEWVNGAFHVEWSDKSKGTEFDRIWLATGFRTAIQNYPCLTTLNAILPLPIVNGLPCLNHDLSWGKDDDEMEEEDGAQEESFQSSIESPSDKSWKHQARQRFWIMGALAAMELGPDAMNLMGGRQGAVRVAKSILYDMMASKEDDNETTTTSSSSSSETSSIW